MCFIYFAEPTESEIPKSLVRHIVYDRLGLSNGRAAQQHDELDAGGLERLGGRVRDGIPLLARAKRPRADRRVPVDGLVEAGVGEDLGLVEEGDSAEEGGLIAGLERESRLDERLEDECWAAEGRQALKAGQRRRARTRVPAAAS